MRSLLVGEYHQSGAPLWTVVGLAIVTFASTNVDDLFVLLGFFADRQFQSRDVVVGQFLGIGILYFASVGFALTAVFIPAAWIGLLGIVPIAIGLNKLREVWQGQEETEMKLERHDKLKLKRNVLTVAAVTIANGSDNIATYTPIFATHSFAETSLIGVVFLMLTAAWCVVPHFMVNHPKIQSPILRYGHRIVPFVLIGIGVMIFHDAGTISLVRR